MGSNQLLIISNRKHNMQGQTGLDANERGEGGNNNKIPFYEKVFFDS